MLIEPSPRHFSRTGRASVNKCEKYLVPALWEETAIQAVVSFIMWAFRSFGKPRSWVISARSYALHSVYLYFSFAFLLFLSLRTYFMDEP